MLGEMAARERAGEPFDDAHMAFINEAVRIDWGCGDPVGAEGWHPKLFFDPRSAVDFDPTIADVHTRPTDEAGVPVGKVLHVGTGGPRMIVATVETCDGVRAYAGLVSSYFETTTADFDRLDDIRWSQQISVATPNDPPWIRDLIPR